MYGDPKGMERPGGWTRFPPHRLRGVAGIEGGASTTRDLLINAILADCYGSQDLIRSGWLPPALVSDSRISCALHTPRGHPGNAPAFLRGRPARSPDGRWWVVSDRTQIPTGAGYALANRVGTSRILPEAFRDRQVQRLAGFFREVKRRWPPRVPAHRQSLVVLLTPGPCQRDLF